MPRQRPAPSTVSVEHALVALWMLYARYTERYDINDYDPRLLAMAIEVLGARATGQPLRSTELSKRLDIPGAFVKRHLAMLVLEANEVLDKPIESRDGTKKLHGKQLKTALADIGWVFEEWCFAGAGVSLAW